MSYCGPRMEKYTSKAVSNAFQCAELFTNVAAKRVLERLAVLERDVVDGLGRVDGLGERHRQPGGAQLAYEAR